ncbi:histidine phosphatase family protein [Clostridium uliginosum]|uniref:Alpha-ribazole phosphatase n=1 Tax=Clostridium uliginosum TaxID=119641 RepID=A0A1I1NXW5_9CLOT|nr:histidine phosphatase family protein [Clostridium uliginosum]SFD02514.1 alpha-ribazole phosphatase [Clostridium uliginosum]
MNDINLYLIRHGKTYCNKEGLYCGKSDIALCDEGISDLMLKKKENDYPVTETYFTSGLKRTNQTLEILYPKEKYDVLPELCEYDFGEFELKSYEDLKDNREYQNWILDDIGTISCPSGESKKQFRERIVIGLNKLVEDLKSKNKKSALIVTHGGTIGTLLEILYDDEKSFLDWQPKVGDGYKLKISTGVPFKIISVTEIF